MTTPPPPAAPAAAPVVEAPLEHPEVYRLLVDSIQDYAIFALDVDGCVRTWNAGARAIKGYEAHEIVGRSFTAFYTPDAVRSGHPLRELEVAAAEGRYEEEGWRLRKDGRRFWASVVITALRDPHGELTGFAKVTRDLTERKRSADRLAEAEERFRRAFDDAPTGVALVTLSGRVTQANAALARILRRPVSELEGCAFDALFPPGYLSRESFVDLRDDRGGQVWVNRSVCLEDGEAWVDVRVVPLRTHEGRWLGFLAHVQDVTQQRDHERQLAVMADTDALTGLLNRRRFGAELDAHLERAARYGPGGALLVLDLDHFKRINDTLGHNAGDELIISVADVLRDSLRSTDVLARLGGDEFAVLLPTGGRDEAVRVASALVTDVHHEVTVLAGGRDRPVTVSIGIAVVETDRTTSGELMAAADGALYDAKDAGRNGWALASTEEHRVPRSRARTSWADRIEQALAEDGFELWAQPIQDLRTGTTHSHELLLRMREPEGLVGPPAFLYVAERLGLVGDIDRWVVRQAIDLLAALQASDPTAQLEVNVSGHSVGDLSFRADVAAMVAASSIDRSGLVFEITETAAVTHITRAKAFAEHLRALGCRFALDDFGAGFGSFYYLKHLPFDIVKIDGEFIASCTGSTMDQMVIRSLVTIAQGLGKQTVAEFVGDEPTRRFLAEAGVDLAQGFHTGRPVPLAQAFPGTVP